MAKIPRNKRRRSSSPPPPPLIKRPKRGSAADGAAELARLARLDAKPDKQALPSSSSSTSSSSKAARVADEEDEDAMMLPHATTSPEGRQEARHQEARHQGIQSKQEDRFVQLKGNHGQHFIASLEAQRRQGHSYHCHQGPGPPGEKDEARQGTSERLESSGRLQLLNSVRRPFRSRQCQL